MASKKNRVFVVGVGMTKFEKPGFKDDYPIMVKEAAQNAFADAGVPPSAIEQAFAGFIYADSGSGQRAIYETLGLSGVPIINVNNNCASGSSAIFLARQLIQNGGAECVLAFGFDKMKKGRLNFLFPERTIPLDKHYDVIVDINGTTSAPEAAHMFGAAGKEHMMKYGTKPEHFAKIALKNHLHSVNNPYSRQNKKITLEQVLESPKIFDYITLLQCCPPSDGAAAAILASEDFVRKHHLESKAVEVLAQELVTDLSSTFDNCMHVVGYDMSRVAAQRCYETAGLKPSDIDVVELHDCFTPNELISYESLGLCEEGKAGEMIDNGDNTYGGKYVINPSGGLLSKGHPLGATGVAQCAELCWQLRGVAGKRQVPGAKVALQHNIGLGGAVVVTIYRMGFPQESSTLKDFNAYPVFKEIENKLQQEGEHLVKRIGGVFGFQVTDGPEGKEATWIVDAKNGKGSVTNDSNKNGDCTLTIGDKDLVDVMTGQISPLTALHKGLLKISGDRSLAFKLQELVFKPGTAKL